MNALTRPVSPPVARSSHLRGRLKQLDPAWMALRNRILSAPPSRLSNARTLVWQDTGPLVPAGALHAQLGQQPVVLAAEHLSLLEPRLADLESLVAPETCTVLVAHALGPVISLLEYMAQRPMTGMSFRRDIAAPGATEVSHLRMGFSVLANSPSQPNHLRGWLQASPALWQSLSLPESREAQPLHRHTFVPLSLHARLGHCHLEITSLRTLVPGDALRLTPRLQRQADGSLPLQLLHTSGLLGAQARLKRHELTLTTPIHTMTPTTSTSSPSSNVSSSDLTSASLADQLTGELHFEIGSLSMSLAEMGRLRAGQTLRLNTRLEDHPIRILSAGREIARGELAAVGEELVVVISDTRQLPHM